ncbi:GNAT family N-acetyltransferase [Aurantiacibacter suaedae]|uniref:GNAT family N-acetyltransferase n=1 Tax=Aurantiacibacter suaedae TaxID=2545755 RepID=UPI0010F694AA|nr:GNAT family N-acetyltransferase [Aurantiacibacter suaedae]
MTALPEGYELTADQSRIDAQAAHAYLARSYWSPGIALEKVERALANSLCVAVFHRGEQIALARAISDKATFAWLADVYVLEDHRGKGLSKAMVAALLAHPELQGLRRWALSTLDAHELYRGFGWDTPAYPERLMERMAPGAHAPAVVQA